MTPERIEELKGAFADRFGLERDVAAKALRGEIQEAMITGAGDGALVELRARYQAVLAAVCPSGEYPDMVAAWPADFAPLPEWLADPAAAAAKDPPGEPFVVRCQPLPAEEEDGEAAAEGEGETVPLDLQAAILAKRAEKSIAEDALRATGTVPVALNTDREVSAEDLGL